MVPQYKGKWEWTGGFLGAVQEISDPRQEAVHPGKGKYRGEIKVKGL